MGLSGMRIWCSSNVQTLLKQCTRTKFSKTSTDPYFGAGEKGVKLLRINVELAHSLSENSMRTI